MAEKKNPSENNETKVLKDKTAKKKESWSVKKILTTVVIVILALLMIGGSFYYIFSPGFKESDNAWGYYDGEAILLENNNVFYNSLMNDSDFQNAYLSGDYNTIMNSYYKAYQNQVVYVAVSKMAEDAKIASPEQLINDLIIESGAYASETESFSEDLYNSATRSQKILTYNFYEDYFPYSVVVNDLTTVITAPAESEFVKEVATKARDLEYFVIDYNAYPDDLALAYGNENADLFAEVSVSMITCTTEENALLASDELAAGTAWNDVVAKYSVDGYSDENGEVGPVQIFSLSGNITDSLDLDKILTAEAGSVTAPIAGPNGWSIYRIDEAYKAADFKDEETLAGVKYYLSTNDAETVQTFIDTMATERAELAKTDFAKAADGFSIYTVEQVSDNVGESTYIAGLDYLDPTGLLAMAADGNEEVSRELFTSEEGYVTGAYQVEGSYVIARVKNADVESAVGQLISSYYNYYAASHAATDCFNAFFSSEKFTDNFYTMIFAQMFN